MNGNQESRIDDTTAVGASLSEPTRSAATACGTELGDVFKQALGQISGGNVLDVATAEGGFIQVLMRSLRNHGIFVGIDRDAQALRTARDAFDRQTNSFVQMDGERLAFRDGSFDTVAISASMHHLDDGPQVLSEMERVLKPAGHFVLAEMHQDGLTEAQLTTVYLHHWVADIDTASGLLHNRTLTRQRLIDDVKLLGLRGVQCHDWADTQSDPMDRRAIERMERLLEERVPSAFEASDLSDLERRARDLRTRLRQVGAMREPVIIIIGEKPKTAERQIGKG